MNIEQIPNPLLLDGGLSNELENLGCDLNHKLWSAHVLESNPEAIIQAHINYLEAGAQCIATVSYQASIPGFTGIGYSEDEAKAFISKSVDYAVEARNRFMGSKADVRRPLIAASIGPYGAYLADGSEYRGNYGLTNQQLIQFHKPRIDIFTNLEIDLLAFETIPSMQEAQVISELLENVELPSWISFSCKSETEISDGTPIRELANLFADHPSIFAVGVNCTAPHFISSLITEIKSSKFEGRIVVYPNAGDSYDAEAKAWIKSSTKINLKEMATEWLELGASIVGGCCQFGPADIQELNEIVS